MNMLLLGAVAMGCVVVGFFFLRFWQKTKDRFFVLFALAFWVEGINRIILGLTGGLEEDIAAVYLVRLLAYVLILAAIIDKNLTTRPRA